MMGSKLLDVINTLLNLAFVVFMLGLTLILPRSWQLKLGKWLMRCKPKYMKVVDRDGNELRPATPEDEGYYITRKEKDA